MTSATSTIDEQARIRTKLERSLPREAERRGALELLANAIENADEERDDAWYLYETRGGLALYAGRLRVCEIGRGSIEISVLGPIPDESRASLGVEGDAGETWKFIPGGLTLSVHVEKAELAWQLLRDPFDRFVDQAMARVRRKVTQEHHSPAGLAYLSTAVGRELPTPSETPKPDDDEDEPAEGGGRKPRLRGRAPIFSHAQRSISSLVSDIEQGTIALPDLQRPFVWEDTKVRDLMDSLFVGFPVGTVVLWHVADGRDARGLGGSAALRATTLIIDGQQRLTSLYAVMKGVDVTDKDGSRRRITIAFRPRDGRFEVADAAIRNDPEWIPNITDLWSQGRLKSAIRRDLLRGLREKGRVVDDAYEMAVEENLDRAQAITEYQFPVVVIQKAATSDEASEEDVAEIFVRINNQGKRLGQADFVLTLLSVFHGDLRDRIEECATEMSRGAVIDLDTQQLLRASCAVGFRRAKMSAVYRFLRGIDAATGDANPAARQQRLVTLDEAAAACIQSTTWRDFDLRVRHAGFVSDELVSSSNAVVNAYAFYVLGRRSGVPKPRLDEAVSRWLFGTLLIARYSSSSESAFEEDLARLGDLSADAADGFASVLDAALAERITGDFWSHTLLGLLETQKRRAPSSLAFRAAQIVLGAKALFSDQSLQNLYTSSARAKRAASEGHHLFPKAWLASQGIKERRKVNQVANLADVGWYENSLIGGDSPAAYVPRVREALAIDDARWGRMCAEHALPPDWHLLEYDAFLRARRSRMADLTRVAYRQLGGEADAAPVMPPWFLPGADVIWGRIGETERALRGVVREVYVARHGDAAAAKIEAAIPEAARGALQHALRSRPPGAEPTSIVDYLYLAQLPPLLFPGDIWEGARKRLGGTPEAKQRLVAAVQTIAPVRNEIAHVREVATDRLKKADVACDEILHMVRMGRDA